MKKMISATILALACCACLQAQEGFEGLHLGLTIQPYNYWLYNKDEINAEPHTVIFIEPRLGRFNGFAGGLTASKFWNNRFGVQAELTYSTQKQRYGQEPYDVAEYNMFRRLDYLKLPLMATLTLSPDMQSTLYVSAGLQLSMLAVYRQERHYKKDDGTTSFDYYYGNHSYRGATFGFYAPDSVTAFAVQHHHDLIFQRFQLGGLLELGWMKDINDTWVIAVGFRGEYDLTRAENIGAKVYHAGPEYYEWDYLHYESVDRLTRAKFHNIRFGLNLSVSRRLGGY